MHFEKDHVMKIALPALIALGGFVLLPAATVIPCVDAADKAAAAVAEGDEGQAALATLCDAGAAERPGPTNFMLPAGGAVVSLFAALGSKSNDVVISTVSTR
ncbi:MAG: hypothetical protein CFE34_19210 [Rhodobacteraceae bacterium PARR1]|nr:MAG: hypothetical protein CFE34_19210 [Rhodobacteraceae bacterium PARR1]